MVTSPSPGLSVAGAPLAFLLAMAMLEEAAEKDPAGDASSDVRALRARAASEIAETPK